MHCDDAARRLYAGESAPDLEIHLSACDECRRLAGDLAGLGRAFARARTEWVPSPRFRVVLPELPWRKLAIAACLLLLPLAGWAGWTVRSSRPAVDLSAYLEPRQAPTPPTDRETLATLFLAETQP